MRRTSWVAVVFVILLGSVTGIASGTFLAWWLPLARATSTGFSDLFSGPFGGKRYVRVLMIGEDDTAKCRKNGNGLSDTLVVVAMDTQTKEVRAISIPRDTRVEIPGHGTCKINSAHVYGGPELTRQVVQDLLGVNIDYYIKTNTRGLRGLVDLVGGVYVLVDKDMKYTDRRGGLYINLKASPNKQLLNGRQAEGFVRFRHDAFGDSGYRIVDGKKVNAGRVVRQQIFMRALANRILSLPTRRERARVMQTAYERKYIVSDLNMLDWDGLADFFKDIRPEEIVMDVLPGAPGNEHGVSYWIPDYEAIHDLVAINLRFEGTPGQQIMAKVEVLNGSGIAGAAAKVADKLKSAGFKVTRTSNAESFDYARCCILARQRKSQPIQKLAQLLRCDDIREKALQDGVDATVIVGRDYSE